jgi:endonuclease/exonuclease/phosphatase family metal-dependent hydrolase
MLLVALFGGGWFVTNGPGIGVLQQFLAQASAPQGQAPFGGFGQQPAAPSYPANNQYPAAPQPANPTIPAISASYRGQPAPPAPPTPFQGGPAIHIASFNIEVFGDTKASKPYVMATLASIIHNFHVVAIQEIRTQDDYFIDNFLRNYVNRDGRRYDRVVGPRLGRSRSTEQYAFLYDTNVVELARSSVYTINDPDDLLHREPLVAMFRTRAPPEQAFTFTLINVHTDPDETDRELDALGQVYQVVRRSAGGEDDVILLGDLNVDDQHLGALGRLQSVRAVVRNTPTNAAKTAQYDNIILHQPSTAEFTGRWGVYDIGQLHNLTPDQVQQVSDHLPVWAEFSAYEAPAPGRFAERGTDGWAK